MVKGTCLAFNEGRRCRAELLELDKVIKDRNGPLMTGNQNTGEDGMSYCPALRAVAAVGLASNDRRSKHAFSQVVGGLQVVDVEKAQEAERTPPASNATCRR